MSETLIDLNNRLQHINKVKIFEENNPNNIDFFHDDIAYQKVKRFVTPYEWPQIKEKLAYIEQLKKEKNAVILAHNYMTPEIYALAADFCGDSLALAMAATNVEADIIVQAGVVFMAETSKILNMDKKVLIPDTEAGCSLASSITENDIKALKRKYPNIPILCYVNTDAAVKAYADICVTSGNATHIVSQLKEDTIIFLPDKYLAENVGAITGKKIITWDGSCIVHETFTTDDITDIRKQNPNVKVLAHPECQDEVVEIADFSGSTAAMSDYVKNHKEDHIALITECSMSDNVAIENPEVNFIKPCNLCPYMKKINLDNIIDCLENGRHEVNVDPVIAEKAKISLDNMFKYSKNLDKGSVTPYLNRTNQNKIKSTMIIENPQTIIS